MIQHFLHLSWQLNEAKQFSRKFLNAITNTYNFKISRSATRFLSTVTNSACQNKLCRHLMKIPGHFKTDLMFIKKIFLLTVPRLFIMSRRCPLYSFGLIADVHYANIDDGANHSKTRNRYYRNSLSHVKTAVANWNARAGTDFKISMVLDLGDLIDGLNVTHKSSVAALKKVGEAFDEVGVPVIHVWGNHDLYNFSREQLYAMPRMNPVLDGHVSRPTEASDWSMYFDVALSPGFRLVVIDCYEISMLGVDEKSDAYKRAEKILREENKNEDLNSPNGLSGEKVRFVKFNGAVSLQQLQWLDGVLCESQKNGEVVIVAGHVPLRLDSDPICLCWNNAEILQVLHRYSCVLAYFAGHAHDETYMCDEHGIHHVVVQGVIEVPPGASAAHLNVHLYDDRVVVVDERTDAVFEFHIQKYHKTIGGLSLSKLKLSESLPESA